MKRSGPALSGKRATSGSVVGEAVGVRASFDIDEDSLFGADGQFNVQPNASAQNAYLERHDPDAYSGWYLDLTG